AGALRGSGRPPLLPRPAPPRPAETPPPAGSGPAERLCPLPRNHHDPCSNRAPALAPTFG
ncbi:hypothetical protein P7K49_022121, partial [Saguinus oedipus]